jgi:hypothetical protein
LYECSSKAVVIRRLKSEQVTDQEAQNNGQTGSESPNNARLSVSTGSPNCSNQSGWKLSDSQPSGNKSQLGNTAGSANQKMSPKYNFGNDRKFKPYSNLKENDYW